MPSARSGGGCLSQNLVTAPEPADLRAPGGIPVTDILDVVCKGIVIGNVQAVRS